MLKLRFSALAAAFLVSANVSAAEMEFALAGGRHLALQTEVGDRQAPWIVFAPGSGCALYDTKHSVALQAVLSAVPGSLLVVNKAGVSLGGSCRSREFKISSVRKTRIADFEHVVADQIPVDAKIIYVGESEGAYILPEVALHDSRTTAVILLSGGTESWIREEIMKTPIAKRASVRKFLMRKVVGHPSYHLSFRGWTYAQLNSYNTNATYLALKNLSVPVLMINGEKDMSTWVQGTRQDVLSLISRGGKSNLEFEMLPGANHGLRCSVKSCDQKKTDQNIRALIDGFTKNL